MGKIRCAAYLNTLERLTGYILYPVYINSGHKIEKLAREYSVKE